MQEAAVAWYEATGETNFLEVAKKNANLMCRTFGYAEDQLKMTSGHQEVELALCKLYRVTGNRRYLELAKFFLDMRGRKDLRKTWSVDTQDHLPVLEQAEALGHAVRAGYMYCGMADVAALTGERDYLKAVDRLWENVVSRKMHLTGGVGAANYCEHPKWGKLWEAYGNEYYLPNESAYLETCAAIANALWNHRMFLWKGEAKYFDIVERIIYNGFLSGISLSGDEFFYPNPLANVKGKGHSAKKPYVRSKWFGCSCCPVNIVRFIPQIPSFAYAADGKGTMYVNLYIDSEVKIDGMKLEVDTEYPWNGKVKIRATSLDGRAGKIKLKLRIPGWARGKPVPSDLYTQVDPSSYDCDNGYIEREFSRKEGATIELDLPMPVKRIRAHAKVEEDRGRLAVERGPIIYCAEGCDNNGKAFDAVLPENATFTEETITIGDRVFPALRASNGLKLVPYFSWCHRDPGNEMQTWFKTAK